MFSAAAARGPETSSEDQRVGPGSYAIPTTLTPIHPTMTCSWSAKMNQEERMRNAQSNGDGSDPDPERINWALKRIISTSKKPPMVKFSKAVSRPDLGAASATKNTRYIQPNGQCGMNQPESHRRNQPKYSLASRTAITGQPGQDTPGPEYRLPILFGTAPTSVFGASSRDGESAGAGDTPGPGSFSKPKAIGKQIESTMKSSASATLVGGGRNQFGSAFGKPGSTPSSAKYKPENCRTGPGVPKITMGSRLADPAASAGSGMRVGPGSYKILTTLTPQHPTIKTSWSAKMSQAKRPSMANPNATQVAPHDTECNHCYPHLSTSKSSPMVGFQKGPRGDFTSAANATPSAQRYHVEDVNMDKLTGYLRSPSCSLSGRTKFGSF
jgi:hypothetical protein